MDMIKRTFSNPKGFFQNMHLKVKNNFCLGKSFLDLLSWLISNKHLHLAVFYCVE